MAQGIDHEWYLGYVADLRAARPDADIALIPVGQLLSRLLSTPPFNAIPATDLYEDDAPHGTPTLYALAAAVTYAALYGAPPPGDYALPATVHPIVRANWPAALDILATQKAVLRPDASTRPAEAIEAPGTAPTPAPAAPAPQAAAPADRPEAQAAPQPALRPEPLRVDLPLAGPDGTGLADPALAMGLNGVTDWTAQQPFLDLMKTARPWIGHSADSWGAFSFEQLVAEGALTADGWPLRLPEGATRLETFILTDMPEEATALEGTYVLQYRGQGKIEVTARAKRPRYEPGRITFQYRPGEGLVGIAISEIDPNDPIRDISVVREDRIALHEAGALFNPDWLAAVEDLRSVRFMDWMFTNASPVETWEDRPREADFSWGWRGVPLEVMIRLANRIGADPWFTLPHMATDRYMAEFAMQVRDTLDPRLHAYVEYSNELWNFAFAQTQWARTAAEARWGAGLPDDAWIQFAGARTAEMSQIWQAAYGDTFEDRVRIVMAVHTGWQGLEQAQMNAPLWQAESSDNKPPSAYAHAYAVTGYFGFEFGTDAFAPTLDSWIEDSVAAATAEGEAQGKRRVALREYVKTRAYDRAFAPAAKALRDGPLRSLITEIWPYHARAAEKAGLSLVMYEGGTHVTAHGGRVNDDTVTEFFTAFNYTPEMARLYDTLLAGWIDASGTLFNAFVDVATPTKWGSWGAQRYLGDDNPRLASLQRYNQTATPSFELRAPGVFLNGVTRIGTSGPDVIEGTIEEDVLIAGAGNDVLISHGRGDVVDGGAGRDTLRLPGTKDMYSFAPNGEGRATARGPMGTLYLRAIELIEFEDDAQGGVPLADLF